MGKMEFGLKLEFILVLSCLICFKHALPRENEERNEDANFFEVLKRLNELNDKELEEIVISAEQTEEFTLHKSRESAFNAQQNLEKKGLTIDKFLNFFKSAKAKYSSVSFTPKKTIDFVRLGTIALETVNSKAIAEDSTFGVFTGASMCLNIFCSPMSLVYYILFGLTYVEDAIVGTKEGVETMNDQVLKRAASLPAVGTATKVTSKFLDLTVEPALKTLETSTKAVTKPIGYAYNVSLKIVNLCTDVKTGMLLANLLTIVADAKNGNNVLQSNLTVLSDLFKKECGDILKDLPTFANVLKGLYIAGVATGEVAEDIYPQELIDKATEGLANSLNGGANSNVGKRAATVKLSSLPDFGTQHFLTRFDPVTNGLKEIYAGIKAARSQMKFFEPVIEFFQAIKRILDSILNFKVCIPFGPFGALLDGILNIGAAFAEGFVDAVNFLSQGDYAGALEFAADGIGDIGDALGDQFNKIGDFAEEYGGKLVEELEDVYNDVKDYVNNAVNVIANSDAGKAVGGAIKSIGSIFGRKRRSICKYDQSPNLDYYYKRNMTLNRNTRGILSGDLLSKLAEFVEGNSICISIRLVLDTVSFLLDSILAPFEKLVSSILKPVLDELQDMFASIFPDLGFLDKFADISIGMLSIGDLTNLVNIFTENDLFKYLRETTEDLSDECKKRAAGHVLLEPTYTFQQVKCACVSGLSGCSKRDLEVDVDIEERSIAGECRYAGIAYQGKQTKTGTGRMCMNWAAKDPHSHTQEGKYMPEMSLALAENYCRIPNNFREPWCFTVDANKRWEYCGIPLCRACITSGKETTGKITYSGAGYKCQAWKTQNPHVHNLKDSDVPEPTLSRAENFCHNPGNKAQGPWCYTTDIGRKWDVCDVPKCGTFSERLLGYKEYTYIDCAGNDLVHKTSYSFENCLTDCDSNSQCKAIGYIPSDQKCWLKSKCAYSKMTYKSSMVTYIKTGAPGYQLYSGKNCDGNVISTVYVSSVKECAEVCYSDTLCVAFLWTSSNSRCQLKDVCLANKLSSSSGNVLYIQDQLQTYRKRSKMDCPGNDLYTKTVSNAQQCSYYCSREPTCVAFYYHNKNCWPKHKCDDSLGSASADLFLKEVGHFARYSDRGCPGKDLKTITNAYSSKWCADQCKHTTDCTAFTWHVKIGKCYLKKECRLQSMNIGSNINSYIMDQAPNYHTYQFRDCPGNDIKYHNVVNPAACAKKCDDDLFCKAFASKETKCWLKHSCDASTLKDSGLDIYIKKSIEFYDANKARDCSGNDIKYTDSGSLDKCADSCLRNSMCVAFQFRSSRCWLKSMCSSLTEISNGNQYKQKRITKYERTLGKDCFGNDISAHNNLALEDCVMKCEQNKQCFAVLYRYSDPRCWLKKKCRPQDFTTNSGLAVHLAVEISGFKLYKNKDCGGNDIQSQTVETIGKCAALCYANPMCVAFGIRNSDYRCWMKRKCDSRKLSNNNLHKIYIIQANRPHTIEIARNKDTYQKSIFNIGISSKAVDGNTGTDYNKDGCTETQWEKNPWWGVYLGGTKTFVHVTIYNRGDCCGDRLKNFQISGRTNKPTTSNMADKQSGMTKCKMVAENRQIFTYTCDKPISAKYLVIQIHGDNKRLTLCEVKVWVVG